MLGLQDLLDRRPGQLSGGQQQRVAMGRAIVREPAAFLMDEPLSNLDAKLRVGMRTSLQQLHARLATTTIYVTHDQVEAMTLGQRVAVMQDGRIQQVDPPQRLYEDPANLFVAAFIGSPAMNLIETNVGGDAIGLGGHSIPLDRERRPRFAQRRRGDRRDPPRGLRGRRVRRVGSAADRRADRGDRGARLRRAPLLPARRREAGGHRGGRIARRRRRSDPARGPERQPLHRARRLPDEGPRRRHDPARGRPVALLLLLAGDR